MRHRPRRPLVPSSMRGLPSTGSWLASHPSHTVLKWLSCASCLFCALIHPLNPLRLLLLSKASIWSMLTLISVTTHPFSPLLLPFLVFLVHWLMCLPISCHGHPCWPCVCLNLSDFTHPGHATLLFSSLVHQGHMWPLFGQHRPSSPCTLPLLSQLIHSACCSFHFGSPSCSNPRACQFW